MNTLFLRPAAAALALVLAAAPAAAQGAPARAVTVSGEVLDGVTGQPVSAARVELLDRGVAAYTDARGRFTLRRVSPGAVQVRVERLGYHSGATTWNVGPGNGKFTVPLPRDSAMFQALSEEMDDLERRRRAAPLAVRVIGREQLAPASEATALVFLGNRGLRPVACSAGAQGCVRIGGRLFAPRVFVDEERLTSGLGALESFRPQEMYLVEIFDGGTMVRLYTVGWVEKALSREVRPLPNIF